jgi:hypothetical protein
MNINNFASVPKLIQVDIDTPEIIEKYGEKITFWTYDVVSLSTYFDFFGARSEQQFNQLEKMIRKLVLLEDGTQAIQDNEDLPIDIAAAAITKIGDILGKSSSRASTPNPGNQPE